ncbi:hypothetical protein MHZ92_01730 [Sporosarcina sp. ACRSL]|nr:hypothetical protein [Sporosarcina sp. ACRSL]
MNEWSNNYSLCRYSCLEWKAATPAKAVTKNGFCEQKRSVASTSWPYRNEERLLRVKAQRYEHKVPAESVRLKRKATAYYKG